MDRIYGKCNALIVVLVGGCGGKRAKHSHPTRRPCLGMDPVRKEKVYLSHRNLSES